MRPEEKVKRIIERLTKAYPTPKTALLFSKPHELLIATILSAQATDKVVNSVTPGLFAKYPTIADYANASIDEIDSSIVKINFHRNKAKSIKGACEMILHTYGGNVPQTLDELDALPGVARKTANVVLGSAFGIAEGIVVDTHVSRLSKRLGLTDKSTPE